MIKPSSMYSPLSSSAVASWYCWYSNTSCSCWILPQWISLRSYLCQCTSSGMLCNGTWPRTVQIFVWIPPVWMQSCQLTWPTSWVRTMVCRTLLSCNHCRSTWHSMPSSCFAHSTSVHPLPSWTSCCGIWQRWSCSIHVVDCKWPSSFWHWTSAINQFSSQWTVLQSCRMWVVCISAWRCASTETPPCWLPVCTETWVQLTRKSDTQMPTWMPRPDGWGHHMLDWPASACTNRCCTVPHVMQYILSMFSTTWWMESIVCMALQLSDTFGDSKSIYLKSTYLP